MREVWKDNLKILIVLFGRKEKVCPTRVGGLLELELQTVYISVLFELFYNQSIQLYNQEIWLKYLHFETKKTDSLLALTLVVVFSCTSGQSRKTEGHSVAKAEGRWSRDQRPRGKEESRAHSPRCLRGWFCLSFSQEESQSLWIGVLLSFCCPLLVQLLLPSPRKWWYRIPWSPSIKSLTVVLDRKLLGWQWRGWGLPLWLS